MKWFEILGLVLTSSLLSAGLTSFVTWRINVANYKREYYKKLLDRRLGAYEKVEGIVSVLGTFVRREDGTLCPFVCAGGEDRWTTFLLQVLEANSQSLWLSSSVSEVITRLNVFIVDVDEARQKGHAEDSPIELYGEANAERFRSFRQEIEALLHRDFRQLSDMKRFIRSSRPVGEVEFSPESVRTP